MKPLFFPEIFLESKSALWENIGNKIYNTQQPRADGLATHLCLTGSGTLLREQARTSFTAVSSEILWPTDTYTGLVASADVRTACVKMEGDIYYEGK